MLSLMTSTFLGQKSESNFIFSKKRIESLIESKQILNRTALLVTHYLTTTGRYLRSLDIATLQCRETQNQCA